ncbi:MAG: hypothetical protein R3B09_10140 [Nannocystaceae bacterium]
MRRSSRSPLRLVFVVLLPVACKTSSEAAPRQPEERPAVAAATEAPTPEAEAEAAPDRRSFAEKERAYHEALTRDARDRGAFEGLARLYYERGVSTSSGYLDLAERVVTQGGRALAEVGRRSAELAYVQGLVWLARGRPDLGGASLREALEIEPGHALAALNLARLELQWRAPEEALRHLAIAGRDPSLELEVRLSEGAAHYALGHRQGAAEALRRAQALAPDDPRPAYNLGRVMLLLDDDMDEAMTRRSFDSARAHFERFRKLASRHPELADRVVKVVDEAARIGDTFQTPCLGRSIQAKARELEALQRQQEAAERERLLDLERRVIEQEAAAAGGAGSDGT